MKSQERNSNGTYLSLQEDIENLQTRHMVAYLCSRWLASGAKKSIRSEFVKLAVSRGAREVV